MEIFEIQVKTQTVIGMRKKGRYKEMAEMFPKLFQFAAEKNLSITGYPVFICHEMSMEEVEKADKEGNADIEVAVPVSGETEDTEDIKFYKLPGGKMAKTIHKGPYEACQATYEKLFAWIAKNGKKISGPIREMYLNDPREVGPEETLTEIHAPIE